MARDIWAEYQASKEADKKAKEEAKYEKGKRALDSKYAKRKESEEIVRAAKLKDAYAAADRLNKPQWMKDNEARIANFKSETKKSPAKSTPVKVTKKEVTVETPDVDTPAVGNFGSVDRTNPEVIGADMGFTKPAPVEERSYNAPSSKVDKSTWEDPMVQARRSMGFKKGGSVKSSASSRGDGIAQRGKTKGSIR
jgi:hypothetical protein